jgi:hypothetical protein
MREHIEGNASESGATEKPATNYTQQNTHPIQTDKPRTQETSLAAHRQSAAFAGTLRDRNEQYIESCGKRGATDHETQTALGVLVQSQTAARNWLSEHGVVVDSGMRRPTPSGRKSIVWVHHSHAPKPEIPPNESLFGGER